MNNDYYKNKIQLKIEELKVYVKTFKKPEYQILRIDTEKFEYGIKLLETIIEEKEE